MASRIVAIDGPSGSGKSSTGLAVARALGFAHLDSGALYRALTLMALNETPPQGDGASDPDIEPLVLLDHAERRGLHLERSGETFEPMLDGQPLGDAIRGSEVTAWVSAVSAVPAIRDWVNARLREVAARDIPIVVDGRDIGTIVFPEAALKVFLTAGPEARARRRLLQRGQEIDRDTLRRETEALAARDRADSARPVAPLRQAKDAVLLDGTDLSLDDQVAAIVKLAKERLKAR